MATIYVCDRCGGRYSEREYILMFNVPVLPIHYRGDLVGGPTRNFDFCRSCLMKLAEWLKKKEEMLRCKHSYRLC